MFVKLLMDFVFPSVFLMKMVTSIVAVSVGAFSFGIWNLISPFCISDNGPALRRNSAMFFFFLF